MPPGMRVTEPKDDADYLERMTKCIFAAGLNWDVVDKKWPNFKKAFLDFDPAKVSKISGRRVRELMADPGIVRNEKKIAATISNASQVLRIQKDFGSFRGYLESFGKDEKRLEADLQDRFGHLGPSTARMFLWSSGYELTPNAEEKKWIAAHR